MYKHKYYKYKNKYNKITEGSNINTDPDLGDGYNTSILDPVPDDELDFRWIPEDEIAENINRLISLKQNFEGFDNDRPSTSEAEFINEDLNQTIIDVGLYGKARGRIYDPATFDDSSFIQLEKKPHKTKILTIETQDDFDDFTQKYGQINDKDQRIYINWNIVAQKYKGFYLKSSSLGDREDTIPYMNRTINSWVYYDFNNIDDVVIFKKLRTLINSRTISRPFKGKIVDDYSVNPEEFANITDTITNDKILLIADIKSFDKFTNKYGKIIGKRNNAYIKINWSKLSEDYDGFYLDKDNDFDRDRYKTAFYNDKEYISWVKKDQIEPGVVYIFA